MARAPSDSDSNETYGIEHLTLNTSADIFPRLGLTKDDFRAALDEKLKNLETVITSASPGLQKCFYETCKRRIDNLASYLIFEVTRKRQLISTAKLNNAILGRKSYDYLAKCLEKDELLGKAARDGFQAGKKPYDIHTTVMKSKEKGERRLDNALITWYHQEQAKLLELELPDEHKKVDEKKLDKFVEKIDRELTTKWWVQHCMGEIDLEKFKDLHDCIKLGFHVTIGRIVCDSLVSNDLMDDKGTDNWRNHVKVIIAFAAYLAVLETCVMENQYKGLDFFCR